VDAALSLALIAWAVWLVWVPQAPSSLLGLVVVTTPMVLFTSAVLSTSSAEVSGSLCASAAAIRLWRDPRSRGGLWAAASGAILVGISRPLGAVWVLFEVLVLIILLRPSGVGRILVARPRLICALALLVAAAVWINLLWLVMFLPPGRRPIGQVLAFVGPSVGSLPVAIGEAIGYFGWQDIRMPWPAYAAWALCFVMLISAALMLGRRREIRALETALALASLSVIGIAAAAVMPTGYTIRGRYILPALFPLGLIAGEVLYRSSGRLVAVAKGSIASAVSCLAATLALVGWFTAAHRYAVGTSGTWLFLGVAQWQPPLGWLTWLIVAILGAVCIGASGFADRRPTTYLPTT